MVQDLTPELPRSEMVSALQRVTCVLGDNHSCFSHVIVYLFIIIFLHSKSWSFSRERYLSAVIMLSCSDFPCACWCPFWNSGLCGTCQRGGKKIRVLTQPQPKYSGCPPNCSFIRKSGCHFPHLNLTFFFTLQSSFLGEVQGGLYSASQYIHQNGISSKQSKLPPELYQ